MNEEDIKICRDALMRAIEEENKKMDRRNRWRKRQKILMILGVSLAFSVGFCKIAVCWFYSIGNFLYIPIRVVRIL